MIENRADILKCLEAIYSGSHLEDHNLDFSDLSNIYFYLDIKSYINLFLRKEIDNNGFYFGGCRVDISLKNKDYRRCYARIDYRKMDDGQVKHGHFNINLDKLVPQQF